MTKTILTAILIMYIGIPLNTGTLAVLPIGNIRHFTVMLKQDYIQNRGAVLMYPRLNQQILVSRNGILITSVGWTLPTLHGLKPKTYFRLQHIKRFPASVDTERTTPAHFVRPYK